MTVNTHHTKLKGDIAVSAVIFDLTKKGYLVSEPMSENAPYDLICDIGNKLLRIQVKCRNNGRIPAKTSWSDKNGTHTNEIDPTKIDYFALVNDDFTKICYPLSEMLGSYMSFVRPNSATPYNWYEDYVEFKATTQPKQKTTDFSLRKKPTQRINYIGITKIQWPSIEEMAILVYQKPTSKLAIDLGVSDVAIGRFCKKHGIEKPERGYWAKQ